MKIYSYLKIALLSLLFLFQSCKTTIPLADNLPGVVVDRFVSVDAILDLRAGMSIDETISKLGSKPYNVLSLQADGHYIIQYKYRLTQFEVNSDNLNTYGIEKKNNTTLYSKGYEDVYIVFNGLGKLEYMVTTKGAMSEQLLRLNNLLYVIKKDKDKFASDSDKSYRETNSNVFYPLIPCPNCDKKK